jgi:hypothetical protein
MYGQVLENLHNGFIQGTVSYPANVTGAYHLLAHWQQADSRESARESAMVEDRAAYE